MRFVYGRGNRRQVWNVGAKDAFTRRSECNALCSVVGLGRPITGKPFHLIVNNHTKV